MVSRNHLTIYGAVEGPVDEAVLRRLLSHFDLKSGSIYGKNGKHDLHQKINGYNQAAQRIPWIVLVDLDHDAECAPDLKKSWVPVPAHFMNFRVAVRKIEAWLLADRKCMASFLGVAVSKMPLSPDDLDDPKRMLVDLALHSRRRDIREDMVPRPGSGRPVGPAYTSRLIEFINDSQSGWKPEEAAAASDSLKRCMMRLREVLKRK